MDNSKFCAFLVVFAILVFISILLKRNGYMYYAYDFFNNTIIAPDFTRMGNSYDFNFKNEGADLAIKKLIDDLNKMGITNTSKVLALHKKNYNVSVNSLAKLFNKIGLGNSDYLSKYSNQLLMQGQLNALANVKSYLISQKVANTIIDNMVRDMTMILNNQVYGFMGPLLISLYKK